ncbi:P1 family peptidase [Halarsenatibacter silvermanii]|uniref:L-aminopeptidase/D-esterase n=1 Tax=Halarsenatibacter silvermanii TaxID=321763 RepID=A0A1G9KQU3_9FIRM|nr:P1 family peptidase [Halarsenatibacter silvermanii]SDL51685.1 L-aminopeptidase/D-esterase [Halarsenatibacter silvermanii]
MKPFTEVPGIEAGSAQDKEAGTGCTVILAGVEGAAAGVDVRGGAPGSREHALLSPDKSVERIHGLLFTGGSAYGLEAAGGVMHFLSERGIGYRTSAVPVPIVPASVIFDLNYGQPKAPGFDLAYEACYRAIQERPLQEGSRGAGTGATAGNALGQEYRMKSGMAGLSCQLKGGVKLGALAVVNCFGEILAENGDVIAGIYDRESEHFLNTMNVLENKQKEGEASGENTILGVVATDADLDPAEASRLAQITHNGLARAVRPAHSLVDGDTMYALSTGSRQIDLSLLGERAAELMAEVIRRAGRRAEKIFSADFVFGDL